jgi:hypothetical protein
MQFVTVEAYLIFHLIMKKSKHYSMTSELMESRDTQGGFLALSLVTVPEFAFQSGGLYKVNIQKHVIGFVLREIPYLTRRCSFILNASEWCSGLLQSST